MFSIPHLVIIFVVVLVVFGPEKLPELARNLGKIMAEFRRATGDLQHSFEDHLRDIERESSLRQAATGAGTTIAPAEQNTIGQPQTDSASAPRSVPRTTSHGWTVSPPNSSAAENTGKPPGSSTETLGATQADVTHVQPDAVEPAQEHPGTEQASAAGADESGHEKGSDGGTSPN
jgi:sec-independent protein translocase protein TatB